MKEEAEENGPTSMDRLMSTPLGYRCLFKVPNDHTNIMFLLIFGAKIQKFEKFQTYMFFIGFILIKILRKIIRHLKRVG